MTQKLPTVVIAKQFNKIKEVLDKNGVVVERTEEMSGTNSFKEAQKKHAQRLGLR